MKIQGEHFFAAPRELVWRALLDPEVLARTLPGCEKLERVSENEFRGALNVQVGPVKGQFQGSLQLSDLVPQESYHMKLSGKGPAGFMEGEGNLHLSADGAGTKLAYDLDSQVGGRIAGLGQRLLESSAKVITRQGLEGLAREVEALRAAAASAAPPPVTAPPSQTRQAARFAGGLLGELVPVERRPTVLGALALLAAIVWLAVRACGK